MSNVTHQPRRRRTDDVPSIDISKLGNPPPPDLPFAVTWTNCLPGVQRPWWLCPVCRRRARILYECKRWCCRRCARLVYQSQRESTEQRAVRQAKRIRHRLGGSLTLFTGAPPRPARMHERTYHRLVQRLYRVEIRSLSSVTLRPAGGARKRSEEEEMARKRIYESSAARQRAYRERLREGPSCPGALPPAMGAHALSPQERVEDFECFLDRVRASARAQGGMVAAFVLRDLDALGPILDDLKGRNV